MKFHSPLLKGTLVKRYKRFLADIVLESGEEITAHCPNPGAMLGLKEPGSVVWASKSLNLKRALPYTWELIRAEGTLVGINTMLPNVLVEEALKERQIPELSTYVSFKKEVKYGENSRIDFLLTGKEGVLTYVEVKNVHLKEEEKAFFPDSVTARGTKHLKELMLLKESGIRACMLYIIQRNDCTTLSPAAHIDPLYTKALYDAYDKGVELLAYSCTLSESEITLEKPVPIILP